MHGCLCKVSLNRLRSELNPCAQSCLPRFLLEILIFKWFIARRLYQCFGTKGLILSDSNETFIFWTDFEKYSIIKFNGNPSCRSGVVTRGRAGGRADIQWTRGLRPAWHTTNLGYDQNFCFDLRPNLELRPAPAPAWRAHIRYHVQFTASARGVWFVLQAGPC
jgi:hypothetical protein